jgi:hypothetical protein
VTEVLSVTEIEAWQKEALEALVNHDKLTIRSGHGVGKSTLLSWIIIWWLSTRYPARVGCTAPTSHQLFDILWSEVVTWLKKAPQNIQSQFRVKSDRIELVERGVDLGGKSSSFAVARTSRKEQPEALAGLHSENMLFIIDESSGVDEAVFETARGALSTPGAKVVQTGNPTRRNGYFYRSHTSLEGWVRMQVPCWASTRVSRSYIDEMGRDYGEDSNVFRVRVAGEFPKQDDDVLIPFELVEAAMHRDIVEPRDLIKIWGLDVARFGNDDTVLTKRSIRTMRHPQIVLQQKDTTEIVGMVKNEWDDTKEIDRPEHIFVDVIGLGSGVVDRGRELHLPMVGINVAELPPVVTSKAFRMRDDLWMNSKKLFESRNFSMVYDEKLLAELTSVKFKILSSGKIQVESKDEMKRRGLKSPNRADSFNLTCARTAAIASGRTRSGQRRKSINERLKNNWVL